TELRSDYKNVARALTRKGTAMDKTAMCCKDYEPFIGPVIETFQKADPNNQPCHNLHTEDSRTTCQNLSQSSY
ncbi:heat shock protein STI-like, partial [Trifolium medium]|nr:heat shock protein STI-like [Trifolium medium]